VSFAAGEWSAQTLEDNGVDLATIGQALGGSASCCCGAATGAGAAGTDFIDEWRARRERGAAANDLIGSPALGGDGTEHSTRTP